MSKRNPIEILIRSYLHGFEGSGTRRIELLWFGMKCGSE
jgi:hypothetical protein